MISANWHDHELRCEVDPRRSGLTTIEFLGCATAVIGGIWLGLVYMGIDVQHLAHNALSQAELLEKLPEDWRPGGPPEQAKSRAQFASELSAELDTLKREIVSLRAGGGESSAVERASDAPTSAMERTLAYWRRLGEIALNESTLQQEAEGAFEEGNAAKVFAVKARISRFAAKAVEATPGQGVDAAVLEFGQQLREWFDRAGELYERAVQIWESPSVQTRAQLNKEWRRSELHHRNEARLIHERAAAVRGAMTRQFGTDFPAFATAAAAHAQVTGVETTSAVE